MTNITSLDSSFATLVKMNTFLYNSHALNVSFLKVMVFTFFFLQITESAVDSTVVSLWGVVCIVELYWAVFVLF